MKKGFTTIELIVAVALLVIVMVICGTVFKVAINAQRSASATAEITRNFRAITDQINRDFDGLVDDGPMAIVLNPDSNDPNRQDSIMFFSATDLQSINQYGSGTPDSVKGNLARILYCLDDSASEPNVLFRKKKIFLPSSALSPTDAEDPCEYEINYIANWENNLTDADLKNATERPVLTTLSSNELQGIVLAKNIKRFSVQVYFDLVGVLEKVVHWYPCDDPDGTGSITSDFPVPTQELLFMFDAGLMADWRNMSPYNENSLPKAIKFTMTLYDSQGIFPEGKTFTHIVYIDK